VVEPLDFTRTADVAATWERIRARWGGVDLVLVVAGTHRPDTRFSPNWR